MTKMTSAYANKVLKKLNADKEFYLNKEREGQTYVASLDEEPVIPDYDYAEVSKEIAEIDSKIVTIKHAINIVNVTNTIDVNGTNMTVDAILVKMAQLNQRRGYLDLMRKRQKKARTETRYLSSAAKPEYKYLNYDLDVVKADYERIDSEIAAMQLALDKFNQTFEFEVEI
ncbi:hypothetical protein [Butyrivibrio sp. LC3010]|uniref:hypothetical protein n=1 Tax=Butyrivibrio sp. LC3010 TaxID=1280680 RepID=UPI0004209532|nr:hypothetical protein [Butyrivibrio sp. LC3010]